MAVERRSGNRLGPARALLVHGLAACIDDAKFALRCREEAATIAIGCDGAPAAVGPTLNASATSV